MTSRRVTAHRLASVASVLVLAFGVGLIVAALANAGPRPALATGVSSGVEGSWRLEGRALTVRLREPLTEADGRGQRMEVRCGESVVGPPPPSGGGVEEAFADTPGVRDVFVTKRTRLLRTTLTRDVAAHANLCVVWASDPDRTPDGLRRRIALAAVSLRLRRGPAPACRAARRETIAHRGARVLVTRLALPGGERVAYRACLRPRGRMQPLGVDPGYDSSQASAEPFASFASGGCWLAWSSQTGGPSVTTAAVELRSMTAARFGRPTRFAYRADRLVGSIRIGQLVVSPAGRVAFTLLTRGVDAQGRDVDEARVEAGAPGHGPAVTLDRADGSGALTDLAISADGKTVTWKNGGVARSAPLP